MALSDTGRLFIWGRASYGRLGLGEKTRDHYSPVELPLPGGHERWRVAAITCGGRHSMCLAVPLREVQGASPGDGPVDGGVTAADVGGGGSMHGAVAAELSFSAARVGSNGITAALQQQQLQQQQLQQQQLQQQQLQQQQQGISSTAAAPATAAHSAPSGIPPPASPLRRPLSAANPEIASSGGAFSSGSGAAAVNAAAGGSSAAAALSLSRAGSYGLPVVQTTVPPSRQTATAEQVRALSPPPRALRNVHYDSSVAGGGGGGGGASVTPTAAATAAAASPPANAPGVGTLLVPLSPSNRSNPAFNLSGALSEVPPLDALPVSGEEDESEEGHVQAEMDRRHGTGIGSVGGSSNALPSSEVEHALRGGGGGGGAGEGGSERGTIEGLTPARNGDGDDYEEEGEGGARAALDQRGFLRIDSVQSVEGDGFGSQGGSPVNPGGSTGFLGSERTSIHNITHLS